MFSNSLVHCPNLDIYAMLIYITSSFAEQNPAQKSRSLYIYEWIQEICMPFHWHKFTKMCLDTTSPLLRILTSYLVIGWWRLTGDIYVKMYAPLGVRSTHAFVRNVPSDAFIKGCVNMGIINVYIIFVLTYKHARSVNISVFFRMHWCTFEIV